MATKVSSLALPSAGSNATMERGEFSISKGKKNAAIRCKVTVPVKNVGGAPAAMTAAMRKLLLALITLDFSYGRNGTFKPFIATAARTMRLLAKKLCGVEVYGWADSTTGLATSIANGATTSLTFDLLVPTGRIAQLGDEHRDDHAAGRSQCRTFELKATRSTSNVISAGAFEIDGSVTVDIYPDEVPCKGDRFSILPEYREEDDGRINAELPEGLPLIVSERTAALASTSLTNVSVSIDAEIVHEQLSPGRIYASWSQAHPSIPAAADFSDEETPLYQPPWGQPKATLPTGAPKVTQNVKDLATIKLAYVYIPTYAGELMQAEYGFAASKLRGKDLLAVAQHATWGEVLPDRLAAYEPAVLFDADDAEFYKFPGAKSDDKGNVSAHIPPALLANLKNSFMAHADGGGVKAANAMVKQLAAAVPGAVPGARGFRRGFSKPLSIFDAWIRGK